MLWWFWFPGIDPMVTFKVLLWGFFALLIDMRTILECNGWSMNLGIWCVLFSEMEDVIDKIWPTHKVSIQSHGENKCNCEYLSLLAIFLVDWCYWLVRTRLECSCTSWWSLILSWTTAGQWTDTHKVPAGLNVIAVGNRLMFLSDVKQTTMLHGMFMEFGVLEV
jgi:hypothetical protein